MILKLSIAVFITQLIFIGCRTWNVRAIAKKDLPQVLLSGAVVHISWLIGITIGTVSMIEIMNNFDWKYIPVVVCSLSGGLLGSWLGLKESFKNK